MDRQKLLTLSKKDFRIEHYRGSGKGGQHRNKTDSACRITHIITGISACSEQERSQFQNKKIAFKRLCDKPEFKQWLKIESMRAAGIMKTEEQMLKEIDKMIERDLKNGNIKIDYI